MAEKTYKSDLKVINIGTQFFYDALVAQDVKATQIDWKPPVKQKPAILQKLQQALLTVCVFGLPAALWMRHLWRWSLFPSPWNRKRRRL